MTHQETKPVKWHQCFSFYSKYFARCILGMDGEPWPEVDGLSASQFQLLISVPVLSPSDSTCISALCILHEEPNHRRDNDQKKKKTNLEGARKKRFKIVTCELDCLSDLVSTTPHKCSCCQSNTCEEEKHCTPSAAKKFLFQLCCHHHPATA